MHFGCIGKRSVRKSPLAYYENISILGDVTMPKHPSVGFLIGISVMDETMSKRKLSSRAVLS